MDDEDAARLALTRLLDQALQAQAQRGSAIDELVGTAYYDSRRDDLVREQPGFAAAAAALAALPEFALRFGPDESPRLALQFVYEAVRRVVGSAPIAVAGEETVDSLFAELKQPLWVARGVANVEFLTVASEVDVPLPFGLGPGVTVRGRSDEDLLALGFQADVWSRLVDDWPSFGSSPYVLVVEAEESKGPDNIVMVGHPDLYTRTEAALLALRLLAPGNVGTGPMFITRAAQFNVGLGGLTRSGGTRGPVVGESTVLTPSLARSVPALAARLDPLLKSGSLPANVQLAMRRFATSYERPFSAPGDAIVDLVTGLEALVGTDQEISFRLAFRVASLLGANDDERVQLFRETRQWYDLRSKLVHGGTLKARHQERLNDWEPLRRIVAQVLHGALALASGTDDGGRAWQNALREDLDERLMSVRDRDALRDAMSRLSG